MKNFHLASSEYHFENACHVLNTIKYFCEVDYLLTDSVYEKSLLQLRKVQMALELSQIPSQLKRLYDENNEPIAALLDAAGIVWGVGGLEGVASSLILSNLDLETTTYIEDIKEDIPKIKNSIYLAEIAAQNNVSFSIQDALFLKVNPPDDHFRACFNSLVMKDLNCIIYDGKPLLKKTLEIQKQFKEQLYNDENIPSFIDDVSLELIQYPQLPTFKNDENFFNNIHLEQIYESKNTNVFINEYYKNNIKNSLSIFEQNENGVDTLLIKDKKAFKAKIDISSFENELKFLKIINFSLMASISYHYGNKVLDKESKTKLNKLADFSIHPVQHSNHKESLFLNSENYEKYIENISLHIERKENDPLKENIVDYSLDKFPLFRNLKKIENEIEISEKLNKTQGKAKPLRF